MKYVIELGDYMIARAKHEEHKVLIALAYHTRARPAELLELRKRDFREPFTWHS